MEIYIPYNFDNWNTYILKERSNRYWASNIKKQESSIVERYAHGLKYTGSYPVKLTITKYFKDKRQDLDNVRVKGVIDGLVKCGVLKNDNLTCITEIELKAEFSDKVGIKVQIQEI